MLEQKITKEKRYRNWHKKAGLCVKCPKPAEHPTNLCKAHRKLERERANLLNPGRYKQREEDGKCKRCAILLDPYIDKGCKTCFKCRHLKSV